MNFGNARKYYLEVVENLTYSFKENESYLLDNGFVKVKKRHIKKCTGIKYKTYYDETQRMNFYVNPDKHLVVQLTRIRWPIWTICVIYYPLFWLFDLVFRGEIMKTYNRMLKIGNCNYSMTYDFTEEELHQLLKLSNLEEYMI